MFTESASKSINGFSSAASATRSSAQDSYLTWFSMLETELDSQYL